MAKYEVGKYEVEITGQGFSKAKSSGNLQFVLQFRILGKLDPNDPEALIDCMPGERKYYKAITENTVQWLMDDLKALGVEGLESWLQLDPEAGHERFIDLTGRKVDMSCKIGADSKSYEDWAFASGGTAKPIERADKKDVKALDRLFGQALRKPAPAAARRAPVPAAANTATAVADDDVPF